MPADRKTDELLAAYVDGIGELELEERRRVERYLAADPTARDEQTATRELIDQLRELDHEPPAQDWAAMEARIHAEVGDDVPRRAWWYRWRFALPAFAVAAAVVMVYVMRQLPADEPSPLVFVPTPVTPEQPFEVQGDRVAVYLDGVDLELVIEDSEALDAELDDLTWAAHADTADSLGFLESTDLGWIDELDDEALARAERLLDQPLRRKGS